VSPLKLGDNPPLAPLEYGASLRLSRQWPGAADGTLVVLPVLQEPEFDDKFADAHVR
jgi:hypothetical protein